MNATVLSLVMATVFAPPAKTSAERSTRIYVRTTPPGASIILDGKELGNSDGLFLVPPGVRKITLEMDGYDPEGKTLDVKEGWITRVEVRMVKKGDADASRVARSIHASSSPTQMFPIIFAADGTPIVDGKPATMENIHAKIRRLENPECVSILLRYPLQTPHSKCQELQAQVSEWQRELGFKSVFMEMLSEQESLLSQAQQQLWKYENELADKLTRYGERHPAVVDLRAHLRATKERIERLKVETVSKRELDSPAAVVEEFLEAVRAGDDEKATSLFTPNARAQVAKLGHQVAPKASATATFDVVKVTSTDDHASVVATWTDFGKTDRMTWLVRSGSAGWRISGMETTVFPGEPPVVLDFENLEEGMRKMRELREAIQSQSTPPVAAMPDERAAKTGGDDAPVRKINLPDADTKDTPVVLDLASGEMLMPPPSHGAAAMEHFTKLGKGDIGVDHGLFCLRGGKIEEVKDGAVRPSEVDGQMGDASLYLLPELPCELLVTTPEKRQFVVNVLQETSDGGLQLEYREFKGEMTKSEPAEQVTPHVTTPAPEDFEPETRLKIQEAKTQMAVMAAAMERYRLDTGELLSMKYGFEALLRCIDDIADPKSWKGPYLKTPAGSIPVDPWGNPYLCSSQGSGDKEIRGILSFGPDGKGGTADDLRNWDPDDYSLLMPEPDMTAGVLEFRIAANVKEAEEFEKSGKDLGWYDSLTKETSQCVTRRQGRRSQILLWETPNKSMTASGDGKQKWQIIQVSVIAEPDRPGRIGVVFDKEGGTPTSETDGREHHAPIGHAGRWSRGLLPNRPYGDWAACRDYRQLLQGRIDPYGHCSPGRHGAESPGSTNPGPVAANESHSLARLDRGWHIVISS